MRTTYPKCTLTKARRPYANADATPRGGMEMDDATRALGAATWERMHAADDGVRYTAANPITGLGVIRLFDDLLHKIVEIVVPQERQQQVRVHPMVWRVVVVRTSASVLV